MFTRLLIANRGEIAVRIARACRGLGIRSVAVYSAADAGALHVRQADDSVPIGGAPPSESYLNIGRIVEAARRTGCEAIHPGYGFLSENPDFAAAVEAAGLVFIGPDPETIRRMGDKTAARALMRRSGVPVIPGSDGSSKPKDLAREAKRLGFPVLVKAAAGGGGRGMRVVPAAPDLAEALESARREAAAAFGDDRVFLEKYLPGAHHVEFQILGDGQGKAIHLFERDCSLQRRHQKIVEETPSPVLTLKVRERMGNAAVAAAKAVGYRGAGTVEFLLNPDRGDFHFLEMNTRLQVEHPITEIRTGVDLVACQIRIAAGEPLWFSTADLEPRGHALECRLYAEDPAARFAPSPGRLIRFKAPTGPGVRVDAGYAGGDEVPIHYDPLVAKIITSGEGREAAIRRMEQALSETEILGITTNLSFLGTILAHPDFRRGETGTDFVARTFRDWSPPGGDLPDEVLVVAALAETLVAPRVEALRREGDDPQRDRYSPWSRRDGFRIGG